MPDFRLRVEAFVSDIPSGMVMTYGQLAVLAGNPRAARQVGGIAHFGDPLLPWHRVVNAKGGLASGYPGGRLAHKLALEAEGVVFKSIDDVYSLDLNQYQWPGND